MGTLNIENKFMTIFDGSALVSKCNTVYILYIRLSVVADVLNFAPLCHIILGAYILFLS